MARRVLLFLILSDLFTVLAMASSEMSPSPSPSSTVDKSSLSNRKLGLHGAIEGGARNVRDPSPSLAPQHEGGTHLTGDQAGSGHAPGEPTSAELTNGGAFNLQTKEIHLKHHHRSTDRSVAGGAIILAGLAVVFLMATFSYIRATRKQKQEPGSPTASTV